MNLRRKSLILGMLCAVGLQLKAQTYKQGEVPIPTRWAKEVTPSNALKAYPRPQLQRGNWTNLNGLWDYSITAKDHVPEVKDGKILVPYPLESALSGVKKQLKPDQNLWYERMFPKPALKAGEKAILHFGAADYEATVYVNGKEVTRHTGGYQSFEADITNALKSGSNKLTVKVWDPSSEGPNPHGKQTLNPENIFYTPSSGIWQTVWLEVVPNSYISSIKITPDVDHSSVKVMVNSNTTVAVTVMTAGRTVAGKTNQTITIPLISPHLWSPDDPYLYDLQVKLNKDEIKSYFGMRKIEIKKDRDGIDKIFLNGKYTYNLGTLDQGFWPDGLYTAPTDEALKFDVQAAKAMGFNTIRKHIKVEPERWYYWTDKLGMLVWQDMVQPGSDNKAGHIEFEKEMKENLQQLYNHPSITTYVLFNEKWGQYDQERLTKAIKGLDPTRIINGHSGEYLYVNHELRSPSPNAYVNADMTDVHSYPYPMMPLKQDGKAQVLGEFGGIGVPIDKHIWDEMKGGWGYDGTVRPPKMQQQYSDMADSLHLLEQQGLSGSIYTQPFDVETELNGLLTYDRSIIKLPAETFRKINAKVWPVTKNWQLATNGFSATVADTINADYATKLKQHQGGDHSPELLKSLAIMALKQNDQINAKKVGQEYIQTLKEPYSPADLQFVFGFTSSIQEPGYFILKNHYKELVNVIDENQVILRLHEMLFRGKILPLLTEAPNWLEIEEIISQSPDFKNLTKVYGDITYYYLTRPQDQPYKMRNLINAARLYDVRGEVYPPSYNEYAWMIFQNCNDKEDLRQGAVWAERAVNKLSGMEKAEAMDTYANLLYKLGRKEEALEWESKAIAESNGNGEIKANYEKMKNGEPTWPQN